MKTYFLLAHCKFLNGRRRLLSVSASVYSKGVGVFGALGHGNLADYRVFQKVKFALGSNLKAISAGMGHSGVISNSHLLLFGRPYDFLSLFRINKFYFESFPYFSRIVSSTTNLFGADGGLFITPVTLDQYQVKSISCSGGLTLFLTHDGNVFAFGFNRWGQCGIDTNAFHVFNPVQVPIADIHMIDSGLQHCIALTKTGKIFTWGKGERGQLGNGKQENLAIPSLISTPTTAKHISAGLNHCAAVLADGSIVVWGKGLSYTKKSLNVSVIDVYEDQLTPRRFELPGGRKAFEVYCRYHVEYAKIISFKVLCTFFYY